MCLASVSEEAAEAVIQTKGRFDEPFDAFDLIGRMICCSHVVQSFPNQACLIASIVAVQQFSILENQFHDVVELVCRVKSHVDVEFLNEIRSSQYSSAELDVLADVVDVVVDGINADFFFMSDEFTSAGGFGNFSENQNFSQLHVTLPDPDREFR